MFVSATMSAASDIVALDASNFGSECSNLLRNSPDFLSDPCKLPGHRFSKVVIGHRFDWVNVSHGVLSRETEQAGGHQGYPASQVPGVPGNGAQPGRAGS